MKVTTWLVWRSRDARAVVQNKVTATIENMSVRFLFILRLITKEGFRFLTNLGMEDEAIAPEAPNTWQYLESVFKAARDTGTHVLIHNTQHDSKDRKFDETQGLAIFCDGGDLSEFWARQRRYKKEIVRRRPTVRTSMAMSMYERARKSVDQLELDLAEMRRMVGRRTVDRDKWRERAKAALTEHYNASVGWMRCRESLEDARQLLQEAREEACELRIERRAAQGEIKTLRDDKANLKAALDVQEVMNEGGQNAIGELRAEVSQLKLDLKQREFQYEACQGALAAQTKKLADVQVDLRFWKGVAEHWKGLALDLENRHGS